MTPGNDNGGNQNPQPLKAAVREEEIAMGEKFKFRALLAALAAAVTLVSCMPATGSPVVDRAVSRAVDTAVDRTVHRVVDGVVNRLVGRLIDTLIDRVFDSLVDAAFGNATVEFGPDFMLDVTSGQYDITVSGSGPVRGPFSARPFTPGADTDIDNVNMAFGVRGQDEEGTSFAGVGLIEATSMPLPWHLYLAEVDDGPAKAYVATFMRTNADGSVDAWQGPFAWNLSVNTSSRLAGSFSASELVSDTAPGSITVHGTFDVNVNASGTLILRGVEH